MGLTIKKKKRNHHQQTTPVSLPHRIFTLRFPVAVILMASLPNRWNSSSSWCNRYTTKGRGGRLKFYIRCACPTLNFSQHRPTDVMASLGRFSIAV
ncbi:hypothetical protein CDAR_388801 [Caerostris darwini]|uniref:Uncharacterized protein n=1 Tax=Caerostris darwini TaxID=1538125 RepID=A0AAV4S3W2_9ARAC|nr:hypothetical protein CDAR_388801 [Caerostris darwini]